MTNTNTALGVATVAVVAVLFVVDTAAVAVTDAVVAFTNVVVATVLLFLLL